MQSRRLSATFACPWILPHALQRMVHGSGSLLFNAELYQPGSRHATCAPPTTSLPGRHGGLHQYARQQDGDHSHDGYDERFCGLFLDELGLRGSPHYPQGPWFTALCRADDEYQRLGPLKPLIPSCQSPEASGVPESLSSRRHEEDLSRSVNAACTRWLAQH
jgi:hypothetical protein